jgi:hypothetical protein
VRPQRLREELNQKTKSAASALIEKSQGTVARMKLVRKTDLRTVLRISRAGIYWRGHHARKDGAEDSASDLPRASANRKPACALRSKRQQRNENQHWNCRRRPKQDKLAVRAPVQTRKQTENELDRENSGRQQLDRGRTRKITARGNETRVKTGAQIEHLTD